MNSVIFLFDLGGRRLGFGGVQGLGFDPGLDLRLFDLDFDLELRDFALGDLDRRACERFFELEPEPRLDFEPEVRPDREPDPLLDLDLDLGFFDGGFLFCEPDRRRF